MSDNLESAATPAEGASAPKKRAGGLSTMLLADLKSMASGLGVAGASSMKKAQLIDAIKGVQSGGRSGGPGGGQGGGQAAQGADTQASEKPGTEKPGTEKPGRQGKGDQATQGRGSQKQGGQGKQGQSKNDQNKDGQNKAKQPAQDGQGKAKQGGGQPKEQEPAPAQTDDGGQGGDDDEAGSRRNRRRRSRDRNRPAAGGGRTDEPQILDDDVLVPAAGILDVLDNYAFVRTSGYLPGTEDVYLSLSMVRRFGLRRGDAVAGQVRQPREGERKEKFNPMVRIDRVNGSDPETARHRVEFDKLTALSPQERLRLETDPANLIGRVIDLAAPIGKGQRGLIVSPADSGKTTILRSVAASITANNPECHLMVVLVDERPEEVTEFERTIKGEVVASTFDRPPADHTTVAELSIERAKRLVELGHDVVVLLDGITRLGRAYNQTAPANGRVLAGGVEASALYPPKRFFGAARNIENGGSLTILATAIVESGSATDEAILDAFHGTENMRLRLRHELAEKRLFPAVDVAASGTRREELLLSREEQAVVWKLRQTLSVYDAEGALELLLDRLRHTQTNIELLMQVQKAGPGTLGPA